MTDENPPPRVSTRALLVHLIGNQHQILEELAAHRRAFEEHTRSQKRHRVLAVLVAIMEWRATLIAGGAVAASLFTKWPWRK